MFPVVCFYMQSVSINVHLQSAVTHTASRSKVAMTEGSAYIYLHAENETGRTKKIRRKYNSIYEIFTQTNMKNSLQESRDVIEHGISCAFIYLGLPFKEHLHIPAAFNYHDIT